MNLKYAAKTALIGLTTNKTRSILTISGIVIGVLSIILIMSLGQGAQNLILSQVQGIGAKLIGVVPGREPSSPLDFLASIGADSLKQRDIDALQKKANAPHIAKLMPMVFGGGIATVGSENYQTTILGVSEIYTDIYNIYPDRGQTFTKEDVLGYSDVIVIGSKVKDKLFGASDAIGQKIKIKNKNLRVVGVLSKNGASGFFNFDEATIMPYTTAQNYIFGKKYFDRISVEADSEQTVDSTVQDIKLTLRNSHNITDPTKDDFFVETSAQALATVGSITSVLTLFLAAIAAISLVVGGIGIMNIMLVSVTERTREIGLRKALGAQEKEIMTQFILEAVMLTLIGGIVGTFLGGLFSFLIALVLSKVLALNWHFILPLSSVAPGLGVSAGIGLIFGLYPARNAAKKEPIEALRYE
ncbi:MAG: ABC transporter permease [Parcubacteria group bacterium]